MEMILLLGSVHARKLAKKSPATNECSTLILLSLQSCFSLKKKKMPLPPVIIRATAPLHDREQPFSQTSDMCPFSCNCALSSLAFSSESKWPPSL
ncbi:hypothetical protein KP509_23G048200 [Ceratopteris richardii]|uniref:Uncharacterized protein n=1 Tax=Ceratopteris richardii TaxID=49495 RepID=A0A8T2S1Y5_CERRI|nr:hypothetical protein KP509_23G048200 [Ceratopteris richardii]